MSRAKLTTLNIACIYWCSAERPNKTEKRGQYTFGDQSPLRTTDFIANWPLAIGQKLRQKRKNLFILRTVLRSRAAQRRDIAVGITTEGIFALATWEVHMYCTFHLRLKSLFSIGLWMKYPITPFRRVADYCTHVPWSTRSTFKKGSRSWRHDDAWLEKVLSGSPFVWGKKVAAIPLRWLFSDKLTVGDRRMLSRRSQVWEGVAILVKPFGRNVRHNLTKVMKWYTDL